MHYSLEKTDAGKDWGQEEKGITEDKMAGWHHWLNGGEFEWTPEVGDGQGGLACCNSWSCKELDMTEQLNWTELNWIPSQRAEIIIEVESKSFHWTLTLFMLNEYVMETEFIIIVMVTTLNNLKRRSKKGILGKFSDNWKLA